MASRLMVRLEERVPGVRFHTPPEPTLSGGVVVFNPSIAEPRQTYLELYETSGVGCAPMGGEFTGIRLCPHIYNLMDEVDRVVEAVAAMA